MKKKIVLYGASGMLGRYVWSYFSSLGHYVIPISRANLDLRNVDQIHLQNFLGNRRPDVIINCAGVIKSRVDSIGALETVQINSVFPRLLSVACRENNVKLLHVSTDCVYNGRSMEGYDEQSPHRRTRHHPGPS